MVITPSAGKALELGGGAIDKWRRDAFRHCDVEPGLLLSEKREGANGKAVLQLVPGNECASIG
jgi:hypothetical protein